MIVMQKKIAFSLILFCLLLGSQIAYADRYLAEGKVAYFRPFSDKLRDFYSDGWVNYQVELSYSPFNSCNPDWWSKFFIWGSYNYLYDSGSIASRFLDDETDIQFYNFSLGLKYIQPLPCNTYVYGAAGLKYIFLRNDNHDETVARRERANGLGEVLSIGFLFQTWRCIVINLYSDVTFKYFRQSNFSSKDHEIAEGVDVSGVSFGLGAGIRF